MASDKEEKPAAVVYQLKLGNDGVPGVTLSFPHRRLLMLMGEKGGEVSYDFSKLRESEEEARRSVERYGEPFREHMRRLVTMGLVSEHPLLGSTTAILRLTDAGRNVVEQIMKQERS